MTHSSEWSGAGLQYRSGPFTARLCCDEAIKKTFAHRIEFAKRGIVMGLGYLHHCFSHGIPSLLPSILVPGQFLRKNVASAQEVICEQ